MEQEVITARELCIGYRTGRTEKPVHERLSFTLHAGELTCLLGANGSGKSTLLRTLSALQPPLKGEIMLMGRPLGRYSERERSRTIGMVLTDKTQTGGLSVSELVALGRQPHTGFFGRLRRHDRARVDEALEAVGMTSKARSRMAELSDGERQKAFIAKALVQECPLILLDEPTAFLDVVSRIEVMSLLHRLAAEQGKAILLSTHDIEQALALADKLWLLSREEGLRCGTTEDMVLNGGMERLFVHPDIGFHPERGVYLAQTESLRRVVLEAADPVLRYWTMNALRRAGCSAIPDGGDNRPETPRLQALSPTELILHQGGKKRRFGSFGELFRVLSR